MPYNTNQGLQQLSDYFSGQLQRTQARNDALIAFTLELKMNEVKEAEARLMKKQEQADAVLQQGKFNVLTALVKQKSDVALETARQVFETGKQEADIKSKETVAKIGAESRMDIAGLKAQKDTNLSSIMTAIFNAEAGITENAINLRNKQKALYQSYLAQGVEPHKIIKDMTIPLTPQSALFYQAEINKMDSLTTGDLEHIKARGLDLANMLQQGNLDETNVEIPTPIPVAAPSIPAPVDPILEYLKGSAK